MTKGNKHKDDTNLHSSSISSKFHHERIYLDVHPVDDIASGPVINALTMEQYLANLEQRDKREQAQKPLIDHCKYNPTSGGLPLMHVTDSKIADKLSKANAEGSQHESTTSPTESTQPSGPNLNSLRADLAAAQKARTALEQEMASLSKLKQESAVQAQLLDTRQKEVLALQRKVNDRNAEVAEGKRMIEEAHDEMLSLNLQFNMAEQKAEKLDRENKELVSRWMKKMGEEADRMNDQSKW